MVKQKYKPAKDSLVYIINKYSNDLKAYIDFFFDIKWPTGFYCEECGRGHQHYFVYQYCVLG